MSGKMDALRSWVEGLGLLDWELAEFDVLAAGIEDEIEGLRARLADAPAAVGGRGNALEADRTGEYVDWLESSAGGTGKPGGPEARPGQGTGDSSGLKPGPQDRPPWRAEC